MANELTLKQIFVEVDTLEHFKELKRATDSTNKYYVVGDDAYLTFGTPDITWDQVAFIKQEQILYARGVFFGQSVDGKFIPYDSIVDDSYRMVNKAISIYDSANADDVATVEGQGLRVAKTDGTEISAVSADTIGVAIADTNINENPNLVSTIQLIPSIQGDQSKVMIQNMINTDNGYTVFEAGHEILDDAWTITGADGSKKFIKIGYCDVPNNWGQKGDLLIHIYDSKKETTDSFYAIRNAGVGTSEDPKYLATEEYVDEKCPDWNIAEFDTEYITTHNYVGIEAPAGYALDKLYVLIHWFGNAAPVATNLFGGFYEGAVTDASKQVLRSNGTNKMGAAYFTANVINLDGISAIAYGDAYMYNSSGSATTLNNPVNSYGIGRFSHSNDFTHFSIHNYPTTSISEAYCCIKYQLKKL